MRNSSPKKRNFPTKLFLLGCLVLAGIITHQLKLINWFELLEISREYAHFWWFPLIIILSKILLYTFALPGTIFYWIAGALYHPHIATVIIVFGGLCGALSAYYFSQRMSDEVAQKVRTSRFFSLIRKHGDFTTLSAVRLFPNFPHAVINYGSGILRIPLSRFIPSTIIGFTVKGFIFASAIHQVVEAEVMTDIFSFKTIVPLLVLVVLFIAAKFLQEYFTTKLPERNRKHNETR